MTINTALSNIYQHAIDNKFGYDFTLLTYYGLVGVGTSNPEKYSNCSSLASECQSVILNNCRSYIVKKGIGKNHEFIDAPLAALLLNHHKLAIFLTEYPEDGYNLKYIRYGEGSDELNVLGTASPLICGFKSFTDIIKPYRPEDDKGNPNVNIRGFNKRAYLDELRGYFNKTDPASITDYYVTQYLSGGGDPNPGNIGFAKIYQVNKSQYEYVIMKVGLGASFKNYSQISGGSPTLEYNKYAFNIDINIKNLQQLYAHVIKNGNILMPGSEYDCEQVSTDCQWTGQGNIGLYNGAYRKNHDYGINMGNYIKIHHLQNSLEKICNVSKDDISNIFKVSADQIHMLLTNTKESGEIPLIKESNEVFSQYIEGRTNFIRTRYDQLCGIEYELDALNQESTDCEPLTYATYDRGHPDFFFNIALAVVVVEAAAILYKAYQHHDHEA